jgi:hypothetical protein
MCLAKNQNPMSHRPKVQGWRPPLLPSKPVQSSYPLGYIKNRYFTAIVTFVDIAGYFDVFATFSVKTHFVALEIATRRPDEMEHGPDSDQVLFPVEGVLDFFATTVFSTVNPGRTTIGCDEAVLIKPCACEATVNE